MNLLDQKLEEKFKLFEEYDKLFANYQPKMNSLELQESSQKNINNSKNITGNQKKKIENDLNENNKFDNIYSNFDLTKNENPCYFRNYEELMNYMYSLKSKVLSNNEKHKKSKNNSKQKIPIKNDNQKFQVQFIPKKDYLIDRLLRYGENLEKKKERMKFEIEKNFKEMANPNISEKAKKIKRNPKKFVERLFYDKYTNDKKKNNKGNSYYYINRKDEKKKKIAENNNFTYRPSINKKSQDIANKLEPSSERILKKKEKKELMDKEECEKLAIDNYKNLFNNNNCFNKYENKKINFSEKKLIYKLYNKGLEDLKKKEMQFQENVQKKNEEFENYSFFPNISLPSKKNNSHKNIKNIKAQVPVRKLKYLNNNFYNKQIEWKKKKNLENSKKKLVEENCYINKNCTFKPDISNEKLKDNEEIIKRNLKTYNSYIEKRRKQIKEEKDKLNKSFPNKKYGFSLKDFFCKEKNNLIYGSKDMNKTSLYKYNKNINYKRNLLFGEEKNNMNIVIPPFSQRIFCYYNENGELNNSVINNNFSNVDYSQIDFIDAINSLHNEIDNLNI